MTFTFPTLFNWIGKLRMIGVITFIAITLQSPIAFGKSKEYVVFSIEGTLEGLTLGQILYEGHKLDIPENTKVNLIGKQGETITIKGPNVVTVTTESEDQEGEDALASISDLLFDENKYVKSVGGTRSTNGETNLEKLLPTNDADKAWAPVLSGSVSYCVKKDAPIIYRETTDVELVVEVDGKESKWEIGSNILNLNILSSSAAADSVISMIIDGQKIRISQFEEPLSSITKQAAWLAQNECTVQALQLLASNIPKKPNE